MLKNMKEQTKSWSFTPEQRAQVITLRRKGRKLKEICEELNVTIAFVRNNVYKETRKAAVNRYYQKNREALCEKMREYYKKNYKK